MAEPTPILPDGKPAPETVWLARVSDTGWVLLTSREAAFDAREAGWRVVGYTRMESRD